MLQCKKCGTWVPDGTNYCPSCGSRIELQPHDFSQGAYSQQDIQQNRAVSVFSYLGILFLIPLLACKNSRFARFHANQGLVLFLTELIFNFCLGVLRLINRFSLIHFGWLISLLNCFSVAFAILSIWGIINVCCGKAAKLPIIGDIQLIR